MTDPINRPTVDVTPSLKRALRAFLDGPDRSIAAANELEVMLDEYEAREPFASLRLALASYRPEGGDLLYDAQSILPDVRAALDALEEE
jgi:hypothetical protein